MKQHIRKAKKAGLTPLEIAQMKQIAAKNAKEMEQQARDIEYVNGLYIMLNVLLADYWQKANNRKIRHFVAQCISLREAVYDKTVSLQQTRDLVHEALGMTLEKALDIEYLETKEKVNG